MRVNPDGTQDTSELSIPTGRRFVVTDVDYCVEQSVEVVLRGYLTAGE